MNIVKTSNGILVLTLDRETEMDIMQHCLNWGVSAMAKSKMIDTSVDDDRTRQLARIETKMWEDFVAARKG